MATPQLSTLAYWNDIKDIFDDTKIQDNAQRKNIFFHFLNLFANTPDNIADATRLATQDQPPGTTVTASAGGLAETKYRYNKFLDDTVAYSIEILQSTSYFWLRQNLHPKYFDKIRNSPLKAMINIAKYLGVHYHNVYITEITARGLIRGGPVIQPELIFVDNAPIGTYDALNDDNIIFGDTNFLVLTPPNPAPNTIANPGGPIQPVNPSHGYARNLDLANIKKAIHNLGCHTLFDIDHYIPPGVPPADDILHYFSTVLKQEVSLHLALQIVKLFNHAGPGYKNIITDDTIYTGSIKNIVDPTFVDSPEYINLRKYIPYKYLKTFLNLTYETMLHVAYFIGVRLFTNDSPPKVKTLTTRANLISYTIEFVASNETYPYKWILPNPGVPVSISNKQTNKLSSIINIGTIFGNISLDLKKYIFMFILIYFSEPVLKNNGDRAKMVNKDEYLTIKNNVNNTGKWVILGFNLNNEVDLISTLNAIKAKM